MRARSRCKHETCKKNDMKTQHLYLVTLVDEIFLDVYTYYKHLDIGIIKLAYFID